MAVAETSALADRLERSGASPELARTIADELTRLREQMRFEVVTREYLDLALGKLRAEVERDMGTLRADLESQITQLRTALEREIAQLRTELERQIAQLRIDIERLLREQTNKLVTWLAASVGVAVTLAGALGVLF